MISIELLPGDLENLRFAYSPLMEVSMSVRRLRKGLCEPGYDGWTQETLAALHTLDLPLMDTLLAGEHYIVDFATPTPSTVRRSFNDELEAMRATPVEVIRKNVLHLIGCAGETAARREVLAHPREAVNRLADEMHQYWRLALAHHWPRIVSVLEGEILHHGRQMALHGVDTMFAALHPNLHYANREIRLLKPQYPQPGHYTLSGEGMVLVPSLFAGCSGTSWQIEPEWTPMIIYAARGAGLWYRREQEDPEKALAVALGEGRARVLHALATPMHTTELAQRLSVTAGAVSQHLSRLQEAGLVEPQRSSHRVYYRLTSRGENLLRLFTD